MFFLDSSFECHWILIFWFNDSHISIVWCFLMSTLVRSLVKAAIWFPDRSNPLCFRHSTQRLSFSFAIIPKSFFNFSFHKISFFLNAAKKPWSGLFFRHAVFSTLLVLYARLSPRERTPGSQGFVSWMIFLPIFPFNFENMRVVYISDFSRFQNFEGKISSFPYYDSPSCTLPFYHISHRTLKSRSDCWNRTTLNLNLFYTVSFPVGFHLRRKLSSVEGLHWLSSFSIVGGTPYLDGPSSGELIL